MPEKLTTRRPMPLLTPRPKTRKTMRQPPLPTPLQKQRRSQLTPKQTKNQQQKRSQLRRNQLMLINQQTNPLTAQLQKPKPNVAHAAVNAISNKNALVSVGRKQLRK